MIKIISGWALMLLICVSTLTAADEFLLPQQAFQLSATANNPQQAELRWQIVPGYYLYQHKLRVTSQTPGIEVAALDLPPAQTQADAFFGEVQIYRQTLQVPLRLERSDSAPDAVQLEVIYQGCADAGLCYPPQRETVELQLAASAPPLLSLRNRTAPDAVLPAEEAFELQAVVDDSHQLQLNWRIAPGTLLYQESIRLSLTANSAVALGDWALPPPLIKHDSVRLDGTIGDVAVYQDSLELAVPLQRFAAEATQIELTVEFQGCAELGICYPPLTKTLHLSLPATDQISQAGMATAKPVVAPARLSEQDRLAARLAVLGSGGAFALFFGLGLLLAFTPCVFPMIPILSGIIVGQGNDLNTRQAFLLALAYVLAMALTYAVIGVIAGLFGANLSAAFQAPWVLILFAAIFVGLALSMFGFYELQLPSSLQTKLTELSNRQDRGTLIGAAIMGVFSALIVGPCVAPPLMGALIFIGQTRDALLGFVALFALGLGMGAPLLLIGTSAGQLLPRAGGWMDVIKAIFGVLLLGVAIMLLERVLPESLALLLWGLLFIASGVYMGALLPLAEHSSGWAKLWKSLGIAVLVYGVLLLIGAASGGGQLSQPLRGLTLAKESSTEASAVTFTRIKTVADLERELATARANHQPVMLDFYADWCVSCKELERDTFPDRGVAQALAPFVLLQADVTANDAADKALLQEHFGLHGPPAMLFFDHHGREQVGYRLVGFVPPARLIAHVEEFVE